MMEIGDKFPDLLGHDADGKEVRLSDFPGKRFIIYFYPKDNTPGCTLEAQSFRDNYATFLETGYQVIGVSVDSMASHQKFRDKHQLPFPLISDTDHRLVEEFGVWGEKSMYGRKYFGTFRTTFIIGEDGTIERVIEPKKIKVKDHAAQILE